MNTKDRFLKALNREVPDRLPVTTHHIMPYFLAKYFGNKSYQEFFEEYALDPIEWVIDYKPETASGEFLDPKHNNPGFLEARRICTDSWYFDEEVLKTDNSGITKKFKIITPEKTLEMILKADQQSTRVIEHLIKDKKDIDIIAKYMVKPKCNTDTIEIYYF